MRAKVIFIGKKQKTNIFSEKPNNQKTKNQKMSFSSSTIIQFTIWDQLLQFRACKSVKIDAISSTDKIVRLSNNRLLYC